MSFFLAFFLAFSLLRFLMGSLSARNDVILKSVGLFLCINDVWFSCFMIEQMIKDVKRVHRVNFIHLRRSAYREQYFSFYAHKWSVVMTECIYHTDVTTDCITPKLSFNQTKSDCGIEASVGSRINK